MLSLSSELLSRFFPFVSIVVATSGVSLPRGLGSSRVWSPLSQRYRSHQLSCRAPHPRPPGAFPKSLWGVLKCSQSGSRESGKVSAEWPYSQTSQASSCEQTETARERERVMDDPHKIYSCFLLETLTLHGLPTRACWERAIIECKAMRCRKKQYEARHIHHRRATSLSRNSESLNPPDCHPQTYRRAPAFSLSFIRSF
ncbi:hypothetical protein BGZ60DRAFT_262767 [Tricladium varicosporioides]|nr:hypothetical protein BGZ60DRAFT_262767 [Hymenoscyphus varicosporioides]